MNGHLGYEDFSEKYFTRLRLLEIETTAGNVIRLKDKKVCIHVLDIHLDASTGSSVPIGWS